MKNIKHLISSNNWFCVTRKCQCKTTWVGWLKREAFNIHNLISFLKKKIKKENYESNLPDIKVFFPFL